MSKAVPSRPKSLPEMSSQWDALAVTRDHQIEGGLDLSFTHVLAPETERLLPDRVEGTILDLGCGTGHFSKRLAARYQHVVGVEPSEGCAQIATRVCASCNNVEIVQGSVEDYAAESGRAQAAAATALMVLQAAPDLLSFMKSARASLAPKSPLIAAIPHPCFWPIYWAYAEEQWFHYGRETFIEAPFVISREDSPVTTTHIHRPLAAYLSAATAAHFRLDAFVEPWPAAHIEMLYPKPWRFPRFAIFRWLAE